MSDFEFQPFQRSPSRVKSYGYLISVFLIYSVLVLMVISQIVLLPVGFSIASSGNADLGFWLMVAGTLMPYVALISYALLRK